jgi:uncharacterized protein (DUF433 family)
MSDADLLSRIAIRSHASDSKPCIKGHGIEVASIFHNLAGGLTVKDILKQYPNLERQDILACFAYAAEMTQEISAVVTKIVKIQQGTVLEYEVADTEE